MIEHSKTLIGGYGRVKSTGLPYGCSTTAKYGSGNVHNMHIGSLCRRT